MSVSLADILRRAAEVQESGQRVIGCLLVKARGSTPQSTGALMIVDDAANLCGTIGGGCVEAEVRQQAFQMMTEGRSGLMSFKLDHDYGWDDGLLCGGTIDLAVGPLPGAAELRRVLDAIESRRPTAVDIVADTDDGSAAYTLRIDPRPRLYVAGAGHVGQALARQAHRLDFDVTLFDDRADILREYPVQGTRAVAGDIAEQIAAAPVDEDTYCVIVTRGHRNDEQVLAAIVERDAGYVGMIGSRRKVKVIFDDLRERGVPGAALDRVHAPVGIDIGSVTVEEIALSISAQLVRVRRGRDVTVVEGPRPVEAGRPE